MFKRNFVLFISCFIYFSNSWAQIGGQLPGATMPGVVGNQLRSQQSTYRATVEQPSVTEKKNKESELSEQAKKITFKLVGIILEGNHVFSDADIRKLYEDKLGKTISIGEFYEIIQSITNYYRNNGYILSRAIIPPQKVTKGIVKVEIIEGFIDQVIVAGHPYCARCLVQLLGNRIKRCPPLNIKLMERYLLLENEIPNLQVKGELSKSTKKVSGAVDIGLNAQYRPITGYASYDNYGTRYIGPQQMTANLTFGSLLDSGDSTSMTMTKTPKGKELTYNDINYNKPLNDEGARWIIGGTRTHTHPLFVLAPLQIDGVNFNYYTNLIFPDIRTRTESLTWRAGFNYADSETLTIQNILLYRDHIRTLSGGGTWSFSDKYYGSNTFSGDVRVGLPILGWTSDTSINADTSRPGGSAKFTKLIVAASRLQAIKGSWSLYGAFQGQYSFDPLLSSEQFAWGGPQMGRGYDTAELIGDKGVGASVELRYDKPIECYFQNLQFYAYYDFGMIWNYKLFGNVQDTIRKLSASSTGLGVRLALTKYLSGNLMWTQSLTKQVSAEELIGRGKRPRVFFSLMYNPY